MHFIATLLRKRARVLIKKFSPVCAGQATEGTLGCYFDFDHLRTHAWPTPSLGLSLNGALCKYMSSYSSNINIQIKTAVWPKEPDTAHFGFRSAAPTTQCKEGAVCRCVGLSVCVCDGQTFQII